MSISPIITFKAGRCEADLSSKPWKVRPVADKGYIYIYEEDEIIHFCWRARNVPMDSPEIDLMILQDARFEPYEYKTSDQPTSKTNGRIFNLKFSSSSQRYLFWLQSKSQSSSGDASYFSPRDLKIGQIVDSLLQGEEVNVEEEIARVQGGDNDRADGDDDETMEDVEGQNTDHHRAGSGGAGADATGGDVREEGHSSREGGADGGRAASGGATDAAAAVQNFLRSLQNNQNLTQQTQSESKLFTTLPDLLPTSTTVPLISSLPASQLDNLLSYLPPTLLLLSQESASQIDGMVEPNAGTTQAALEAMSVEQKRDLISKVLRSPQFHQSLGSLTVALRDGGLPMIGGALGLNLGSGAGMMRGGNVPLGGGEAVEAFVEGVKRSVEGEKK